MAICDLCGQHCRAAELEPLLDIYQIEGVVDICPDCRDWANSTKSDLVKNIAAQMRHIIAARKGAPPRRRGWLSRLFDF